jgi:hypothetical protein
VPARKRAGAAEPASSRDLAFIVDLCSDLTVWWFSLSPDFWWLGLGIAPAILPFHPFCGGGAVFVVGARF